MKFAKELESDLVPEWRAKYLDYKQGKKKLKAVARALRTVERTPSTGGQRETSPLATFGQAPFYAFLNRPRTRSTDRRASSGDFQPRVSGEHGEEDGSPKRSAAVQIPGAEDAERAPLQLNEGRKVTRYGSIVGTPPNNDSSPMLSRRNEDSASLRLPGPALGSPRPKSSRLARQESSGSAYQVGDGTPRPQHGSLALPSRYRSIFQPKRVNSMPGVQDAQPTRPPTRRMFTMHGNDAGDQDIALNAYREVDVRQAEFFMFLDKEMEKIEDFYKLKEDEANDRLKALREQLHIMRDQHMEELFWQTSTGVDKRPSQLTDGLTSSGLMSRNSTMNGDDAQLLKKTNIKDAWHKSTNRLPGRKHTQQPGKAFEAMKALGTPNAPRPHDDHRDYVRRERKQDVNYRTAKRKLKIALAEYYRGLELLKSYALLNRTAFRKINKKFDKTVNARPSGRYMSEKVNKAYFVNSTVLDGHIQVVEDLYARYFERGNHKVAVGKLRAKIARAGDYTGSVFRNGVLLATGAVFGIEGLVYGTELLFHKSDPTLATNTSYLLQIYGGYFLMLFLTLLFCLACRVWQNSKVNYAFIFEFDARHSLDWRQLSEIPSLLGFCLGLTMWLNFKGVGDNSFYVYWPCVLVGISALVLLNPFPFFYHRSRGWFLYSNWRLLCAGLYPVEFRDFFLGDMFCSLTYAIGNVELFFCLYAHYWNNPPQCNSSHSMLMGFFTTLPGIWRALQCIRRYRDTRNWFPHLANFGKYMCTILYYMTLSLYRLDKTHERRAVFILFATINAVYCSGWDIIMDWSLGDFYAKHRGLRTTLGFKYAWWYYAAMVIDPIIRFNWIFYAIYTQDAQHSTICSFLVGFTEVLRRGIWQLFRVENEHCTNVGRFRASRDVPLPYEVPKTQEDMAEEDTDVPHDVESQRPTGVKRSSATGADVDHRPSTSSGRPNALRQRRKTISEASPSPMIRAFTRVGTLLHTAHAQDFERRKKPELGKTADGDELDDDDDDSEEENDNGTVEEDEQDGELERRNGKERDTTGDEAEAEVESGEGEGSSADDAGAVEAVRTLRKG